MALAESQCGKCKAAARQCDFAVHRGRHGGAGEIVTIMADGFVDPANTAAFTSAIIVGICADA